MVSRLIFCIHLPNMDCGCFHGYDLHGSGFSFSISSALGEDTMMKAVEGLMGI